MSELCYKLRAAVPRKVLAELKKREKKTETISEILRKVLQFCFVHADEVCAMIDNEYIQVLYAEHGVLAGAPVRIDFKVSDTLYCYVTRITEQLNMPREQALGRMCAVYIYYASLREQQQIDRKPEKVVVPLKIPGIKTQTAFNEPMYDVMSRVQWGTSITQIVETCAGSLGIQPLSYLDADVRHRYRWIACDIDAVKLGYYLVLQNPDKLQELKKAYQACLQIIDGFASVPTLAKNILDGIQHMLYGRLLADGYSDTVIRAMMVQFEYWSTRPNARRGTALQSAYQSAYDNIDSVAGMLASCELIEQDLCDTLAQYRNRIEDTLLIVDPPYLLSRTVPYTHNNRDMAYHARLAETLRSLGTPYVLFCRVSASRSSPRRIKTQSDYKLEDALLHSFYERYYKGCWYYDVSVPSAGGTTIERVITNLPMQGVDSWKVQS